MHETCNVREQAVTIAPGQSHTMGAIIQAEKGSIE